MILYLNECTINLNGEVRFNSEVDFTIDSYLEVLSQISENDALYRDLTPKPYIKGWEAMQGFTTIEELWDERDRFENMIKEKK